MKISESVMTWLVTLLGILPFIWFAYIGKQTSGKNKKLIKELLKDDDLTFNEKEFWNHNFIGIDEAKHTLLFIKLKSPENKMVKIDLNDVKSCHIHKNTKDYKRDKKMESELQTLNLELAFYSKQMSVNLNFYDIEDLLSEDFEMKRAEKWHTFIQQNINKQKLNEAAA